MLPARESVDFGNHAGISCEHEDTAGEVKMMRIVCSVSDCQVNGAHESRLMTHLEFGMSVNVSGKLFGLCLCEHVSVMIPNNVKCYKYQIQPQLGTFPEL